jgi:hypothetical protein
VRCYPDEVSLVAQQACEQVVKTLMSELALHSLMESMVDHTDMSWIIFQARHLRDLTIVWTAIKCLK